MRKPGISGGGGGSGSADTEFADANGPQANLPGRILVGGDFTTDGGINPDQLARLNADGSLDTSFFNGDGTKVAGVAVKRIDRFGTAEQAPITYAAPADISDSLRELAADRSQKENKPKNGRHGGAFTGPIAIVADSIQFQDNINAPSPAPASPVGAFPGATVGGEYALNDARQTQMQATQPMTGDNWDNSATAGWKLAADGVDVDAASPQNQTGGGQEFYRNNDGAIKAANIPVLGDVPMTGRLMARRARPANTPPVTPLPSAPNNNSWSSFRRQHRSAGGNGSSPSQPTDHVLCLQLGR